MEESIRYNQSLRAELDASFDGYREELGNAKGERRTVLVGRIMEDYIPFSLSKQIRNPTYDASELVKEAIKHLEDKYGFDLPVGDALNYISRRRSDIPTNIPLSTIRRPNLKLMREDAKARREAKD